MAHRETEVALALTFDYGQKAATQEIKASSKIAKKLNAPHRVLNVPWLAKISRTALTNTKAEIPSVKEADLQNMEKLRKTASDVWVPNRNGLFLNIAACFADALDVSLLVTGFNAEESLTFPDNSRAFMRAADDFFWYATSNHAKVVSYTAAMEKPAIAKSAIDFGLDVDDLWFCYQGGAKPCEHCESCVRNFRAFRIAHKTGS